MPVEDDGRWRVQTTGPLLHSRGLQPWDEVCGGPFVARRPFTLHAHHYVPGEPVPADAAEQRILRNLYSVRRITVADAPAAIVPQPVAIVPAPQPVLVEAVLVEAADTGAEPVVAAAVESLPVDSEVAAEAAGQPIRRRRGRPRALPPLAS